MHFKNNQVCIVSHTAGGGARMGNASSFGAAMGKHVHVSHHITS